MVVCAREKNKIEKGRGKAKETGLIFKSKTRKDLIDRMTLQERS